MRLTDRPRTLSQIRGDIEWPAALQTVMDRALANDPDERYQKVADFGRDILRAVESMPAHAFTSAGTVEFSMPAAATQAIGTLPTAGRPTGSKTMGTAPRGSMAAPDVGPDDAKVFGRGRMFSGIGGVVLAAALGAFFFLKSRDKPAPELRPVSTPVAAASPVAGDSASTSASADSSSRVAGPPAPDTAAPAPDVSKGGAAAAAADARAEESERASATVRTAAVAIRARIREGTALANDSDYELAAIRFKRAQDDLTPLVRNFARRSEVQALRGELRAAIGVAKSQCDAERRLALRDGETPPVCQF